MLKHYWTTALRQIRQSKLFSAINIVGFTISITAAFFIYLWVVDELSYDRFHQDTDDIYRVLSIKKDKSGTPQYNENNVFALSEAFRTDFPKIADATQFYFAGDSKMALQYGESKIEGSTADVDGGFFQFFSFPVVEGNPARLASEPNTLVISDKLAQKLFGKESAIDKTVIHNYFGNEIAYTVVGVVKVPQKSHLQFEIAKNITPLITRYYQGSEWRSKSSKVYIKKKKGTEFTADDLKKMSQMMGEKGGDPETFLDFQSLADVHLNSDKVNGSTSKGDVKMIYMFISLALIVIFMGAFNFTTLSTARASLRYKEVGVRKVCGSIRKKLINQFMIESVVQSCVALLLAIGLAELLLPYFNTLANKGIQIGFDWTTLLFALICIVGIGCLAGSYPAFYLSSVNVLTALKGGTQTGKKGTLNKWLATVQFVFAITLMLCSAIMLKQLDYVKNKDLGLDKNNVVSVFCNLWYRVGDFKQEVAKNSNVLSVSMGAPIDNYAAGWEGSNIKWEVNGKADSLRMVSVWSDNDFVNTYGLKIIAGEAPKSDLGAYFGGTMKSTIIINETAWKQMKVDNPVGITTNWGEIAGVVKDFHFRSLREKMSPAFLVYNPECLQTLHIRIAPDKKQETLRFLKEKYEEMNKGKVFEYTFFEDQLNNNYRAERQQSSIFIIFTIVAICIAMMGVLGLVILTTRRRTKEIGIRKVNGAHTDTIVKMLCLQYLKWVALAYVIACPVAWWLMDRWLQSFAYRTAMSWWIFALVGAITVLIALVAVGIQSYRTASQDPVKSLRYE